MNNCLNCGKELVQIEGKRSKKFCDNTCRSNYWQKTNRKKEPKYVRYETFKELKDKFDILVANKTQGETKKEKVIEDIQNNKKAAVAPENTEKEESKTLSEKEIKEIESQIKEWQNKKCPVYMGKNEFEKIKEKEITELKSKLLK